MRCKFPLLLLTTLTIGSVKEARALPVYLSPEHALPTGHHSRDVLERNTRNVRNELWFKVQTADQATGWVQFESIIHPAELSLRARLVREASLREKPDPQVLPMKTLSAGVKVEILERRNHWFRVRSQLNRHDLGWLEIQNLMPENHDIGWIITKSQVPLLTKPAPSSPRRRLIPAGALLKPVRMNPPYLYVSYENRGVTEAGYILDEALITRLDFSPKVITKDGSRVGRGLRLTDHQYYEIHTDPGFLLVGAKPTPLYEKPNLSSKIVSALQPFHPLRTDERAMVRWGEVLLGRQGPLWWPINSDELWEDPEPARTVASPTTNRFLYRLSSPVLPHLTIAVGGGIFRSKNGKSWEKIDQFGDENLPIAFTSKGTLFVGPYVSRDHGNTFAPFIRWDELIRSLEFRYGRQPRKIKMVRTEPRDDHGLKIIVHLDIGYNQPVSLITQDGGRSWLCL